MGRRPRDLSEPCCYHITHRCQERRLLLRFEIDRQQYVKRLREMVQRYAVDVLDYVVTGNHVHLLLWAAEAGDVSAAMHFLQGNAARDYNRRKAREGAFWRGRYHPTLIETGRHLSRCVFYIDMNMVRAGVCRHPSEWRSAGYHELCGQRQRWRVLNRRRLLDCLGSGLELVRFEAWYNRTIEEMVHRGYLVREAVWSESLAVGSRDWLERFGPVAGTRIRPVAASPFDVDGPGESELREVEPVYSLAGPARARTEFWRRQQSVR